MIADIVCALWEDVVWWCVACGVVQTLSRWNRLRPTIEYINMLNAYVKKK